ncbi:MAG: hypothetical protein JWO95_877 [Verrucomicrobiales bacterium]|nr:hypothetical protein [Verrucomicrobiales bacterium]
MNQHLCKRALSFFVFLTSCTASLFAQAPANISAFTNQTMSLLTTNGASFSASTVRFFTNNTVLTIGGGLVTTTNAAYVNLSPTTGDLTLFDARGTNDLTMNFATSTNGLYTNVFRATGGSQQTNRGAFSLVVGTNAAPVIYFTSTDQILQSNSSITISIAASGFGNSYQWRKNGTNINGVTTSFLQLLNFQPTDAGSFTCVVTNTGGSVTSSVISVSLAVPIVISQQPQSQDILEGSFFSVGLVASGSIQIIAWYRGSSFLSSGTNPTYTVQNTVAATAGNYYAILDNYGRSVTSQVATVTVRRAGTNATWLSRPFVKIADDKMIVPGFTNHHFTNWLAGQNTPLITYRDGKVHFVAGTTAGFRSLFRWTNGVLSTLIFTNTVRTEGGFFTDLFYPTDEGNGVVNFTDNGTGGLGMTAYSSTGITNIINSNTLVPGRTNAMGLPGSYGRRNYGVAFGSSIIKEPGQFTIIGAGIFFHDGTNLTRICDETTPLPGGLSGYGFRPTANSVNFDGTNLVFSTAGVPPGNLGGFYKSTPTGVMTRLADSSTLRPGTASTFTNFSDIDIDGGLTFAVANSVIYKFESDNSATNIGTGTYVSAAGPRVAYFGGTSSLSQWNDGLVQTVLTSGRLVDGRFVSQILAADGQGDDILVLLKFTDNSEGIFLVSGPVSALPQVGTQPLDFNAINGGGASFYVSGAGQGPLNFQWLKDSVALNDQTNASLVLSNVNSADLAGYSAVIQNPNGSITSRVAQLTMTTPTVPVFLSFLKQIGSAYYGSNVSFTATASGAAPLVYSWERGGDGISAGAPIVGATNSTLSLTNIGDVDNAYYGIIVSNGNGSVTNRLGLTVLPVFTQQPQSVTNVIGGNATFSVGVLGIAPITYQWQRLSPVTSISGATNATLTFTNLASTNAGSYRVFIISGSGASDASATVSLTVLSNNPPIAPLLQSAAFANGQFTFILPTENGFSYQVESKTNLTDAIWTPEQTLPGDGTPKPITISVDTPKKFLHVKVQ